MKSRENVAAQKEAVKGAIKYPERGGKSDRPLRRYLGVALFKTLGEGACRRDGRPSSRKRD